ncbi:MAG TPA: hypothetical protein VFW84_12750 [Aquabacterium sp.]|uniref:hypothetical protein n=1 Tax=Aquabacterium sp. TaxID=1872578 RepID=UPI002E3152DD|nr:hypothetical protein [Aquabacterium sp.]HEX5373593.1 hypothetical protein [Aquabacterium sp.]
MRTSLWIGLMVMVGASVFLSIQDADEIEPVTRAGARPEARTSQVEPRRRGGASGSADATLRQQEEARQRAFVWSVQGWQQRLSDGGHDLGGNPSRRTSGWSSQQPPQVAPPPPPPPPPPMAPPFPHTWIGRYDDDVPRAVVAGSARTWVVQSGDVIDSQWRVDAVNAREMRLTYLPLQQSQTVMWK